MPPLAEQRDEYAVPVVPRFTMHDKVMPAATVRVYERETDAGEGKELSVTVTLTLDVPALAGVPVMTPLDGLIASPEGRPTAFQVYGVMPPVADTVLE